MAKRKNSRKKRQKNSAANQQADVVRMIHLEAGRLDAPAPRIFKDKSKYSRKAKHQRRYHDDSSFFYALNPSIISTFLKKLTIY